MNIDNLNKEQIEAVLHQKGPCLVLAGAGSGKTKVLTTRIAKLIDSGIDSYNILAITFTNKAAKEMRERVEGLIGDTYSFVGTFHSFGLRIIKENYLDLGLLKNFTIIDSDDQNSIIKKIMKEFDIDSKEISASFIKNKISYIKNQMLSKGEIEKHLTDYLEKIAIKVYYEYENILRRNNTLDFDDLLRMPVKLFSEREDILDKYQERYKYILIDEYQDTNEVQYKLVKLLASKYRNLFVVGDVNQSIYGFRWSNYKNILNFVKDYPEAKTITLNQNYRSTNIILKAANSVIKNNQNTKEVKLYSDLGEGIKIQYFKCSTDNEEMAMVTKEISKLLSEGYTYSDIAILYRTNAQSRAIEDAILKKNWPYKVVGSYYFYKRKEIKDLICYLRLIANHNDNESLIRIINVPKRGIGAKSIGDLDIQARENNTSMFEVLNKPKELEFKELILSLSEKIKDLDLSQIIDLVLEESGMKKELEAEHSLEADIRLENLMEFKSITENFQKDVGTVNLEDFLESISLFTDTSDQVEGDAITLMTMHSAKGLEFRVVFMVGMEENIIPHSRSVDNLEELEEERRLCYVAITRAKEKLYITNAKRRMLYGHVMFNLPSRFIREIDENLVNVIENKPKIFNRVEVSKKTNNTYAHGDVVLHSMYGRGVIVDVSDRFITVAFNKRYGVKKFLSDYQGLKKM